MLSSLSLIYPADLKKMYLKNFHRLSLLILLVSFTVIPDSRAFQITGAENKYLAIDDPSREEVKLHH